jgi:hypothetical protein
LSSLIENASIGEYEPGHAKDKYFKNRLFRTSEESFGVWQKDETNREYCLEEDQDRCHRGEDGERGKGVQVTEELQLMTLWRGQWLCMTPRS